MSVNFRGNGCSAQIRSTKGGFTLTLRDRLGRIVKRRTYGTYDLASSQMWRWSDRWMIV